MLAARKIFIKTNILKFRSITLSPISKKLRVSFFSTTETAPQSAPAKTAIDPKLLAEIDWSSSKRKWHWWLTEGVHNYEQTPSKRKSKKLQRIIKKKTKAATKRSKKLEKTQKPRLKKDPGLPNLYPFKKQLLQKIMKGKKDFIAEKLAAKNDKITNPLENVLKNNEDDKNDINSNGVKIPTKNKKYAQMLDKVIEDSDIVLFILDARDPNGCRNRAVEAQVAGRESAALQTAKRLVLVLNKIDLVPAAVTAQWVAHLRREHPTVAFKASTQEQRRHLGASHTAQSDLTDRELSHTNLVVGYPNVGKSSIINSLKRKKIAATSAVPGHTKAVQEVALDKKVKVLDSPGVIFSEKTNYAALVLRNSLRVELLDRPGDFVSQILAKCPAENLCEVYQISPFKNTEEFLYLVANKKGILQKGGTANTDLAARAVIRDWNSGKISYYTEPPKTSESDDKDVITILGRAEDAPGVESILEQNLGDIDACEMRAQGRPRGFDTFVEMRDE